MKIRIHSKNVDSKLKLAMHAMCEFALARLDVSKRIRKNLSLSIHMGHHDSEGEAKLGKYANRYRPRDFKVIIAHHQAEIDDYDRKRTDTEWGHTILRTLAHELVHVKQYLMGELTWRDKGMLWKGEICNADHLIDHLETPYEVEAYGREKGLLVSILMKWTEIEEELGMEYALE